MMISDVMFAAVLNCLGPGIPSEHTKRNLALLIRLCASLAELSRIANAEVTLYVLLL